MKMTDSVQASVPILVPKPLITNTANGDAPAPANWMNTILNAHTPGAYGVYPPVPMQQLMAYMIQQMGEAKPSFGGIGYHLGLGQYQGVSSNIDPLLLPNGQPTFFNNISQSLSQQQESNVKNGIVTHNDGIRYPFMQPAPVPSPISNGLVNTPKRKLSQTNFELETPSRSQRKRRPTKRFLKSLDTGSN